MSAVESSSTKNNLCIKALVYRKRRAGNEFEVELDDGSIFALDAELIVQFHLKTGSQLSHGDIDQMKARQEVLTAKRRLLRYLALRRKTRKQCEQYLHRLMFGEEAMTQAMAAATSLGYIDDEQFASAYTRTQERGSRKGPRVVKQELEMHGLSRELAARAVAPLGDADTQRQRAHELAEKRMTQLRREDPRKARIKLRDFLMRKGYDTDICLEIVKEMMTGDIEDDE